MPNAKERPTLIVDDDVSILKIMQKYLQKKGHTIMTASNGYDALKLLHSNQNICKVISDLKMPEMGGELLLQEIRKENSQIPFYIMTGYPEEEKVAKLQQNGVADIFIKPLDLQVLEKKIFENNLNFVQ